MIGCLGVFVTRNEIFSVCRLLACSVKGGMQK